MERIFRKLEQYFGTWKIGILNPDRGLWSLLPSVNKLGYLRAMNASGYHIFMKPEDESRFLLLDDIPKNKLLHQKELKRFKPGRLVVETSPGNFQVWIKALRSISNPEKRYWIRFFRADPACDPNLRWGRCPGFRNCKSKYGKKGRFPLSRLIWVDWEKVAQVPKVNLPEKTVDRRPIRVKAIKQCLSGNPIMRTDYDRGDESATDFAYALALLRRGMNPEVVADRLLQERKDWTHHNGQRRQAAYLQRTIRRAVETISQ